MRGGYFDIIYTSQKWACTSIAVKRPANIRALANRANVDMQIPENQTQSHLNDINLTKNFIIDLNQQNNVYVSFQLR